MYLEEEIDGEHEYTFSFSTRLAVDEYVVVPR
jgi:hypothetical protein